MAATETQSTALADRCAIEHLLARAAWPPLTSLYANHAAALQAAGEFFFERKLKAKGR
jgi:hypothetical protein